DVGLELLLPDVFQRPGAGVARRLRARMRAVLVERGKRAVLARRADARLRREALKPTQAIGHVILKARLRQFAIADHVDAERDLLLDDIPDRDLPLVRQRLLVVASAGHAREQLG